METRIGEYTITTVFTGEPWCENCYLVLHEPTSEQILIDPGDNIEGIVQALKGQEGILKNILITHAHHDHVGVAPQLCEQFQVSCSLLKAEERLLRRVHTYALAFDKREMDPFKAPCNFIEEGPLEIGAQKIRVIPAPGHTPGGACFHFGDFIFTGDTLMYQHVGRADLPGSKMEELAASVERLFQELSDDTIIFAGHGRTWTVKEAKEWWEATSLDPPQYARFGVI